MLAFLLTAMGPSTEISTPNGNWALSQLDVYNMASYWLPDQFDFTQPAGSVAALLESLGATGGVFAIYSHGYDEFTLAQWTQLFQLLKQDGATCVTMSCAKSLHRLTRNVGSRWYQ